MVASVSSTVSEAGPGQAVTACARALLASAPVTAAYRQGLQATLELPGNMLSTSPDYRWARPVWTCCAAADGQWEGAAPTAAAVELFMVASDLLDDVEDGEATPIGTASNTPCTLNLTTGLLLLALRELLGSPAGLVAADLLLEAGLQACAGQDADLTLHAADTIDLRSALDITARKSGSLVAVACRLGALAGGADSAAQERFAQFGRCAGIVAQLANDLAALDPRAPGKTDLALDKPTLPLAYAARRRAVQEEALSDRGEPRRTGALSFTWVVAETYRQHALALVPALADDPIHQRALFNLVRRL